LTASACAFALVDCGRCDNCCYLGHTKNPDDDADDDVKVVVTGYYSSSRRAAQTPCEDIQIRFPLPEPWVYLFRVERRFKYGAVHSATRRPGRIKGFERLTQLAQGILPPSLIEVTAGLAKYEHVFKAIVWRIDQLPERNEGIALLKFRFA